MKTIEPVAPAAVMPAPEWIRIAQATAWCGIPKPTLYRLMDAGKIRFASLRNRGAAQGTRLISFASLKAFLEKKADEGPPPMPGKPKRGKEEG